MKDRLTTKRDGLPTFAGSGVYSITNRRTGKLYVGSAFVVSRRLYHHRERLRKGTHENQYLQRAWNKYGEAAFRLDVVEACPPSRVLKREQFWMDKTDSYNRQYGYNICPVAGSAMAGRTHSEESRRKMSRARKGKVPTAATAAAAKATHWTKRPGADAIIARGAGKRRGQKRSPEVRARMAANHWCRKPGAAEVRASIAPRREAKRRERMAAARAFAQQQGS